MILAPSLISPPAIGELCCAKCERRQRFYRGRVISHEVEKIRIFFVDFGFTEVVALKDLKRLPDYLQAVPFFSVKINLAKVTPELFTKKVSEYLEKLLKAEVELILVSKFFIVIFYIDSIQTIYN